MKDRIIDMTDEIEREKENKERKQQALEIKKILDEASKAYYNSSEPIMSDEEFDYTCNLYEKLSGEKYNTETEPEKEVTVVSKNKVTNKKNTIIEHTFKGLLGTIDYKFPKEPTSDALKDLKEWLISQIRTFKLDSNNISILVTEKYDGNSLSIEYENGKAVKATTRGKNGKGLDLLPIFKNDRLLKPIKDYIGVKYEVILTYDNLEKLNKEREKNGESTYKNPRNTVAGLLSRTDSDKYRKYLTLVPISLKFRDKEISREEEIKYIDEYVNQSDVSLVREFYDGNIKDIYKSIKQKYNDYITERLEMHYMIDGLVIEFLTDNNEELFGRFASGSPKWSCAIKFPYMEKTTTVEDIIFEASPNGTGKITPSVIYKPVTFIGNEMRKTSLANYKRFKELKLGKGSKIVVSYHNDVLSYVDKLNAPENDKIKPIPFTNKCPACGGEVRIHTNDKGEETFVYCNNKKCYMKLLGKINNITNQLDMKGIDILTLEKIYNAGYLNKVSDLFKLEYRKISKIEGLGNTSAMNIIQSVRNVNPDDYELLAALGIKNLGKDTAKNIFKEFTFDELLNKEYISTDEFYEKLLNIDGIADKMANYIQKGLIKKHNLLNVLHENIDYRSLTHVKVDKSEQLIFVITGDTDPKYFADRKEVKDYVESKGHKLTSSVSGKTNYLVTEDTTSGTKKNLEAAKRGIPIITCSQLVDLLG